MKFRQAKKIVEHCNKYRGWYHGTPHWYKKAVQVYVHHKKRSNRRFYESRGIINKQGQIIL